MRTSEVEHDIEVKEGELVGIIDGPFKDFEGKVSEVDRARGKLKVLVNMFGRETPVELDFLQIKKV
jgi:transcriptional antiterminator NusG